MQGEDCEHDAFKAIFANAAELHAHFLILQVILNQLCADEDSAEQGSLSQLLGVLELKKHNVQNVAGNYNGWKDTLTTVFDAYLLCAAMMFFGMSSLSSKPKHHREVFKGKPSWETLMNVYLEFDALYISCLKRPSVSPGLPQAVSQVCEGKLCKGCGKYFTDASQFRSHMVKCATKVDLAILEADDYKFNFGCVTLNSLMMWQVKHMSVKDCHADLNHACWKAEYPHMVADGRGNYQIEAEYRISSLLLFTSNCR